MSARPLLTRQAPPPAAASRNPGRAVRCPPRGGLGGPLLTSAPFLSRRGPPRALPQTVVPSVGGSSAARPAPLRAALPRASGLRRPSRRPPSSPSASPPPGRRPSEALPGAMSASGDPGQAPGGQDSPVGAVGAWAPVAAGGGGGGNGVVLESGPQQAQAAGVAGSAGGVGMEVVGLHLAIDPEGGGAHAEEAEDDSDFGPADEDGEEAPEDDLDILVDAHQFPMVSFRFMFLDLVHSLLHRINCNNHILVRPRGGGMVVPPQPQLRDSLGQHPVPLAALPTPAAAADVHESEASSEEEADWETAEEPDEEPEMGPAAADGTTPYQYENSDKEAQGSERGKEKEKFDNKQDGPN
ncbi:cancer/testis antigen 47A-like [Canis lupus familiaris]|uniref:cancer/testis antigen 47A-like n=1 Tax=Canis lupus dingo TaxID=286419 RepID=UPI000DC6A8BC|nr:cancer/testis antigen 47A-like [Canis lupus dingo]XP_025287643.3 cancer/testis antigen 47A-like [Canis lupus dingo]XP_025287649.1 cancer/testis antigen family 47 member A11 [Canis lupus dingo]XP_025287650.1 cancer/testis antigen family 47 member A11 [Canis lupus dingo]XP_038304981.1 cancer/testis antigen 47A-like [Canis lupus familiaris]XP_038320507.1 cancer/testis antigen 47A-like [Canis lupus familiaris]XP_038320508.1 cancer/testis antigen 47A-like [Canis lupus familiaris]XP_038444091.1